MLCIWVRWCKEKKNIAFAMHLIQNVLLATLVVGPT